MSVFYRSLAGGSINIEKCDISTHLPDLCIFDFAHFEFEKDEKVNFQKSYLPIKFATLNKR